MTNRFPMPSNKTQMGRRDALRVGGIALSLGAIVAACGNGREGDQGPGRVGYAPPITEPPEYAVDDAVLLRTVSSVENTIVAVYEEALSLKVLDAETVTLIEQLIADHQAISEEMGTLTAVAGGEAWECTNSWMMDRLVEPVMETIAASDNQAGDLVSLAVSLESLAAATNQTFAAQLSTTEARSAAIAAASIEARHAAFLPIVAYGTDAYIDPAVLNQEVDEDAVGLPQWYAVPSTFGTTGQITLVIGAPDENGTRTTYFLQTPAANSYVYNELEPTC